MRDILFRSIFMMFTLFLLQLLLTFIVFYHVQLCGTLKCPAVALNSLLYIIQGISNNKGNF